MIPIALLHFVTGKNYRGPYPDFVNSYLIDIILPFGVYFLLCLPTHRLLQPWWAKALIVFGIGATVEALQYFGIAVFGNTFDPLDFVMYAAGAILAAFCDTLIFPRIFGFWTEPPIVGKPN